MTFLSRRKHPTTAPQTRAARRALSLTCLLAVAGGTVSAQYSGRPTYPPPPGTVRPQAQVQPQRPASASAGKIMYFQKPADSLAPTSGAGGDPVAQADTPALPVPGAPREIPMPPPLPLTGPGLAAPPVPDRPLPTPPGPVRLAQPEPTAQPGKQPDPLDKKFGQPDKKFEPPPKAKDPKEYTILPPRDLIFVIYDDAQLEKVIMDRLRRDLKDTPEYKKNPEAIEATLKFPTYTDLPGAGQTYHAKTASYVPMQVNYDALYVVH